MTDLSVLTLLPVATLAIAFFVGATELRNKPVKVRTDRDRSRRR